MMQGLAKRLGLLVIGLAGMAATAHGQQGVPMPPGNMPGTMTMPGTVPGTMVPGQPQQPPNSVCGRLEAQLGFIDRGGVDPARADQIRRYEEATSKQQFDLDRVVAQARRLGCESSGFFLFGGGQPAQCGDLNNQIQHMRSNLERMMSDQRRLESTGDLDRGEQRRAVLAALAQNDCGPQYRAAQRPTNFFERLFGGPSSPTTPPAAVGPDFGSADASQGTYRTLCVRTCDGFYFPISYATVPAKFVDDERACQRECPQSEVALFTHRNPGEDVSQAVSTAGKPYVDLPNAFRYRREYNAACSCKRPGQTWADALGAHDDTLERGDIVVTDERAKAMAQPKPDQAKPRQDSRRSKTDPRAAPADASAASTTPSGTSDADPPPAPSASTPVRSVGPKYAPVRSSTGQ